MSSIKYVFSVKKSCVVNVSEILAYPEDKLFKLRRALREERKGSILCAVCFQSLHLSGSKDQRLHFKHNPGSEDCPVKTTCELTHDEILAIKYNGQKEGLLHKKYKSLIANHLLSDSSFTNVFVEKTFREESETGVAKQWRRPDIIAERKFDSLKVAFELQVSTTFIDVIIARESFYKRNNVAIFWVFLKFDNSKFTEKDIFYSSNYNAFVFDIEAKLTSDVSGELHFKCYFTDFELVEDGDVVSIVELKKCELAKVSELTYYEKIGKLLHFDVEQKKSSVLNAKEKRIEEIKAEKARIEREKEAIRAKALLNTQESHVKYQRPSRTLSNKVKKEVESRKGLDNLKCGNCNNNHNFRSVGPFIICNVCDSDVKY